MKYILSEEEISFIGKSFHYPKLLGVEEKKYDAPIVIRSLESKKYIEQIMNDNYCDEIKYELNNELRIIFSSWSKTQYALSRPDMVTKEHLFCLLTDRVVCILLDNNRGAVTVDTLEATAENLDMCISNIMEFEDVIVSNEQFIITVEPSEFEKIMKYKKDNSFVEWSNRTGIDVGQLQKYHNTICDKRKFKSGLAENIITDTGALIQIKENSDVICALKHITPPDESKERFVLIMGGTEYVRNSIYNI